MRSLRLTLPADLLLTVLLLAAVGPCENNLPLGLTLEGGYVETRLPIGRGQVFTLGTDGVGEATAVGTEELFGFARTQAISTGSAAIAEAAQTFGHGAPQAGDITVLIVTRSPITIEAAP